MTGNYGIYANGCRGTWLPYPLHTQILQNKRRKCRKIFIMTDTNIFQFAQEIPWEDLGNGIQRQVFGYDEKLMLVKAKFEAGAIGAMHQHPHSQATYVDSGVFEMTIGQDKRIIRKGDGYYVPPNESHGCICLEPGVLIDAFSPQREDFLI